MNLPEKKLGFGFMRLPETDPKDATSIDMPQIMKMADLFFQRGFTYCDTAWMYHNFKSEEAVGETVVSRYPRDSFTIATKMPDMMLKSADEVGEIYEAQKKKLGVDHFDYYLIHNMDHENYEKAKKFDAIDFCRRKRDEGEIRCLGFSFHDTAKFLDQVLTENPDFEFVQLQINYLDWESLSVQSRACYETAVKHGMKVIVMEPVKGGTLANPPENVVKMLAEVHPDWSPASWAIRFAASLPEVMVVLSGMSNLEQLDENTKFMENFTPLTEDEFNLLLKAADMIRATYPIPCTGCRYCVEANHCPKKIAIPEYFRWFNARALAHAEGESFETKLYNDEIASRSGSAADCIGCHGCEKVCPQHIKITEWLPKVHEDLTSQ